VDAYALAHPQPVPDGVPNDWDKSIPIPAHATVTEVSDLQGSMRRIDFLTQGETYAGLKSFYTTELGIAGYTVETLSKNRQTRPFTSLFRPVDGTQRVHFSGPAETEGVRRSCRIRGGYDRHKDEHIEFSEKAV
jgi:hypothetical protein